MIYSHKYQTIFTVKKFTAILLVVLFSIKFLYSQNSGQINDSLSQSGLRTLVIIEGGLFAGTMTGLYFLWYKNYPMNSFHLINDNSEWYQMDKISHAAASYYIGKFGYSAFRWAGINERKSIWYGGLYGSAYLLTIEILDGFSKEWGFSMGDLTANTIGTAIFLSQQLAWHEQRIVMKFSTHPTEFAKYRTDLFGESKPQQLMKDYNGWTYWLSGNIYSFLPKSSTFPKWLNVAVGVGAEGMVGAYSNPLTYNGNNLPVFERYRQFYLSLDVDLTRIPTKSKTLDLFFDIIGFIKIPFPTLEYNTKDGFKFHSLYF